MRVLLVSGSYPPMKCGIGAYTARLASALADRPGLEVAVLTDVAAGTRRFDQKVEVLPVADGWVWRDLPRITKSAEDWAPTVAHVQYPTQGYGTRLLPYMLPLAFFLRRIPTVQTWHEFWLGRFRSVPNAVVPGGLVFVRPGHLKRVPRTYRFLMKRKIVREIPNASPLPIAALTDAERAQTRRRYVPNGRRMVVYFGFAYPAKGVEAIFEVANPTRDHIVLVCDLSERDDYHGRLLQLAGEPRWSGKASFTGYLPDEDAASLLASADAIVLPFRDGGGNWNTSVHAGRSQGTFVLTTSEELRGFVPAENCYYASPGKLDEMRMALDRHMGSRALRHADKPQAAWPAIAEAHEVLYHEVVALSRSDESH